MIKLIVCDLDRTLLPNGHEQDDGGLSVFSTFVKDRTFTLAYASGRNLGLFKEACEEFPLPLPDYFFGDVGTVLYKNDQDEMREDDSWFSYISKNTPNWEWNTIKEITTHPHARLQEDWRQNTYKLSYYVDDLLRGQLVADEMSKSLEKNNISASAIYSVDPLKNVGLIDILPTIATKVTAVEFLRTQLKLEKDEVVYCGDSGNDILPLTNGYKSILVANASPEVRQAVLALHKQNNTEQNLYIASGNELQNGNFASGVMEGLVHFGAISMEELFSIIK